MIGTVDRPHDNIRQVAFESRGTRKGSSLTAGGIGLKGDSYPDRPVLGTPLKVGWCNLWNYWATCFPLGTAGPCNGGDISAAFFDEASVGEGVAVVGAVSCGT